MRQTQIARLVGVIAVLLAAASLIFAAIQH